ncbi:hypothetical protein LXL04_016724 [Taraxacum kok-saghyz]
MEPLIQTLYFLSGGATTLNFMLQSEGTMKQLDQKIKKRTKIKITNEIGQVIGSLKVKTEYPTRNVGCGGWVTPEDGIRGGKGDSEAGSEDGWSSKQPTCPKRDIFQIGCGDWMTPEDGIRGGKGDSEAGSEAGWSPRQPTCPKRDIFRNGRLEWNRRYTFQKQDGPLKKSLTGCVHRSSSLTRR